MELFNEVKNRYFQMVFRIINECADGKAKKDILKIIDEGEFEQKVIGKNFRSFSGLILNEYEGEENYNLLKEEDGLFYPAIENGESAPLPVRFTKLEKMWLKALLEEPCITMLVSKETIERLREQLNDMDTPIRSEYLEMTNVINLPDISDYAGYEQNFRVILKAIIEEKAIRYSNTDKFGNVYRGMVSLPVSIEFSMRDRRFRLSMYSLDSNRPVMANLFSMKDIILIDYDDAVINRETAKRMLHEQKYSQEPAILEVTDRKAAMERCFMSFSGMERTAKCLGGNRYEIKLNYYMFEEENLINSILSLGPYVKVVSPERIGKEVVRRVKRSVELADSVF